MTLTHGRAVRSRSAFTLVELVVLAALLVALGLLIAWGVRRTSRVASLKALRDMGVTVEMNGEELTGIRFENCFLGDEVMVDHVANLGTFQTLKVRNTDVGDAGLKAIPDPAAITHLDLTLTGISDESLKFIGEECPNLTSLDLTATLISDEGLASLTSLTRLETLKLAECRLTYSSLLHLVKLRSLKQLDLSFCTLSGEELDEVPKLEGLKELRLSGDYSYTARKHIWQLFPESKVLFTINEFHEGEGTSSDLRKSRPEWITGNRIRLGDRIQERNRRIAVEVPAVELIQKSGGDAYGNLHIVRVDLTSADFGDANVKSLYPLRMLSNLQLSGTGISDRFAEHLAGFRRLEILQLSKTGVADQTGRILARLSFLRELDLRHTKITDESMKTVAQSGRLMILDISDTDVTDDGLAHLLLQDSVTAKEVAAPKFRPNSFSQAHRNLRVLGLSGTKITDKSIRLLLTCPKLQEISVGRTGLSEEGLARLRKEFQGRVRLQFLKFHPAWPVETSN